MVLFIDDHRSVYGVEPICDVLPIAPSTYYEHRRRRDDPSRRPARARRDDELREHIQRVWDESFGLYGVQKVRPGVEVKPELTEAAPTPLVGATEGSAADAPPGTTKDMSGMAGESSAMGGGSGDEGAVSESGGKTE